MKTKSLLIALTVISLAASRANAETATNTINGFTTNVSGSYYVGNTGPFNGLIITNAGALSGSSISYIGNAAGSSNNTALVTGTGSTWTNSNLVIGYSGAANQLNIQNGGLAYTLMGYVGYNASSTGNTLLVTGPNSRYNNNSDLQFGVSGGGNQLTISGGGLVNVNGTGYVGYNGGSSNNAVLVTGNNSVWSNASLIVGLASVGNSLTLTNSGAVSVSANTVIGSYASAVNNSLNLNGGTFTAGGNLEVRNGALNLNGGAVTANNLIATNNSASATNALLNLNFGTLTTYGAQVTPPSGGALAIGNTPGQTATWNIPGGINTVNGDSYLGNAASASANVLVTGTGTVWTNSGALFVGFATGANNSQLTLTNGAQVFASKGDIGYDGTTNSVFVTGANSLWSNSGMLVVGDHSAGNQLTIANGAQVNNGEGDIGYAAGSTGNAVLVTGSGAQWNNGGSVFVGNSGSGNQLTIANGAQVNNGSSYIGNAAGASNNAVLVTGTKSSWRNFDALNVGYSGSGNQFTVANGAQVQSAGAIGGNYSGIGRYANANNNLALVTGAGSTWINTSPFFFVGTGGAGGFGSGNSLIVSNGGSYIGTPIGCYIGNYQAANNSLVVTGPGSSLLLTQTNSSIGTCSFMIGRDHDGRGSSSNSLTIANGGVVTNHAVGGSVNLVGIGYAYYIQERGGVSSNNYAVVTGPGSLWYVYDDLQGSNQVYVGYSSIGSSLSLSAGGQMIIAGTNNNLFELGYYDAGMQPTLSDNSAHNSLTVTGTNSLLAIQNGDFYIGDGSSGNTVTIANGGGITNVNSYLGYISDPVNNTNSANNVVAVTGANAFWNCASLYIGYFAACDSNQLTIANGGAIRVGATGVNVGFGSGNHTIVVTGANSLWNNAGPFTLGNQYGGNQMTISNGGAVSNADASVGPNGGNNTIVVTGGNSLWNNAGNLTIGYSAGNNQLTISNGAQVSVSGAVDGQRTSGNTITVTGSGSVFNNAAASGIQQFAIDGLVVSDGAAVTNGAYASAGNALVTGNHSIWNVGNNLGAILTVDGSGAVVRAGGLFSGQCVLTNGGQLFSAGGQVLSPNLKVAVTGSGSVWNNTGLLKLAKQQNGVQMTIANGGVVTGTSACLGSPVNDSLSYNNNVMVTDPGSLWSLSGSLTNGGANYQSITVSNSATIAVGGNIVVGQASADNNLQMIVSGGSLIATNAGAGALNLMRGVLVLNGGTCAVNSYTNSGALNIGLTGNGSNGHVTASGSAQLGGPLTVTNLNGFQPAPWNTFTLLTAQTVNGTFTATNLPALAAGLNWQLTYAPTSVVLRVVAAAGPLTALKFTANPVISGTSLTISATNTGADTIYLLTSTNVAAPRNTWKPIWTNVLTGNGSLTTNLLNVVSPARHQQFYLLGNTNNN